MTQIWVLGAVLCLFGSAYADEVCYDGLGCFSDLPPWGGTKERPLAKLPWVPGMIETRFLLFTPKNKYYHEIKADAKIMKVTNYNKLKATRFIIPGYLEAKDEDWAQHMCKDMLKWDSVNCIAMEWKAGVRAPYAQAANNARVVAAQVAHMINFLMGNYKQTADKFHIIGHSLGAHAAGEVGRLVPNLARITGLDPVEPYFQGASRDVRLDTSDAAFVDVIHTDSLPFTKNKLGLGMSGNMGHIDFYPNGGELMPGCSKNSGSPSNLDGIWEGNVNFDGCNHARAYQYYSESTVKAHGFVAYPCPDKESFAAGMCFPCTGASCPLMGQSAIKFNLTSVPTGTKFFLTTGKKEPFGRYSYRAKVLLEGSVWPNPGFMYISLKGDREETESIQLHVGMLSPGFYELLINTDKDVGEIKEMTFQWNNHIFNPIKPTYSASRIELVRGKDNKTYNFCGGDRVGEKVIQSVPPCKT
ncbi:inactive pancreatic lipase-related protein 1-like [Gadus macrocephalus]|uniref:inactive pancreatic lipase-related protein 1-like n=1 Tax=Gadus macrocephalus TaxID=80720 RepID=UPI0028CB8F4D|nr:inactive pancreatic lipase-related protein 1-like [Gadus macrocephalus]